ncbi:MAG: EutN/CcmL family microcompartment protein [Planctomycetota bacterium]
MNFATVVGTVWATRKHPALAGRTLQILRPESAAGEPFDRLLIAVDTVGAGPGERVFYVTAREAVLAMPNCKEAPVDAAIVGIVEGVEDRS